MRTRVIQGAFLAIDPSNGHILAMIGGRDFDKNRFNRATQALRQPGSAFKPFIYTAAIDNGYRPTDQLLDTAISVTLEDGTVTIARALAMEPKVMLFDEPTSALDPELVGEVLKVIRDLANEGRTMILVTHEMKFARDVSSHVIYLHKGVIEEEGPPQQVFGAPKSARCKQFVSGIH